MQLFVLVFVLTIRVCAFALIIQLRLNPKCCRSKYHSHFHTYTLAGLFLSNNLPVATTTIRFVQLFPLTSIEQSVLARGRNANLTASKKSKGENITAYQDSSAFEALLGYTYICDKYRFIEMISWMKKELDELDAVH